MTTSLTVVKVGGRAQAEPALAGALAAAWHTAAGSLVVVHGGGDEASALQRAYGREPQFVDGRRVTAREDIDLLRMALSGSANKRLVGALGAAGAPALGLSGEDGRLFVAAVDPADAALGRVGRVRGVNVRLLRDLLAAGWLPVVSPLGADAAEPGEALNVNGDDAAAALAAAIGATELLLVTDVPAVLAPGPDGALAPIATLDADEAEALVAGGIAKGGMAAKLAAARSALEAGVARVRIADVAGIADASRGTVVTPAPERIHA